MVIVPLPIEIKEVNIKDKQILYFNLPDSNIKGHYTIKVFDNNNSVELYGAVTLSESIPLLKAIIVAGGGPYEGNKIWDSTLECANLAYSSLLYQGLKKENIYYLSADKNVMENAFEYASYTNLYNALQWGKDANELLIYIVDHGGNSTFKINEHESLAANTLKEILDDIQSTVTEKQIIIYDACYSGTFTPILKGNKRVIITSASNETITFADAGQIKAGNSFSFHFWSYLFFKPELRKAFEYAYELVNKYTDNQTPNIDANENGEPNEGQDYAIASKIIIGRGYGYEVNLPTILSISPPEILHGEKSHTIFAGGVLDLKGISHVLAIITPPQYPLKPLDAPITELPSIELFDNDHDGIYEGIYSDIDIKGTYEISVYAVNKSGVFSLPKKTIIEQKKGYIYGDINMDGLLNIVDTILYMKLLSKKIEINIDQYEEITLQADINMNGIIGCEDVIGFLQILCGGF